MLTILEKENSNWAIITISKRNNFRVALIVPKAVVRIIEEQVKSNQQKNKINTAVMSSALGDDDIRPLALKNLEDAIKN